MYKEQEMWQIETHTHTHAHHTHRGVLPKPHMHIEKLLFLQSMTCIYRDRVCLPLHRPLDIHCVITGFYVVTL